MLKIARAAALVFGERGYLSAAFAAAVFAFALFVGLPARLIPGNSFSFQLKLLEPQDFALIVVLSVLVALSLVMNVYLWRKIRVAKTCAVSASAGVVGWLSALVASLFGAATCAACVSVIFGFLGFGTVLALISYRTPIVVVSAALLLVSLYISSGYVLDLKRPVRAQ